MPRDRHARGLLNITSVIIIIISTAMLSDLLVDTGISSNPKQDTVTNFTDNGFIAIEGLAAPTEIKDSYTWARDKSYASFLALQEFIKQHDLMNAPPPPDIKLDLSPDYSTAEETTQHKHDDTEIGPACGSLKARKTPSDAPCLTRERTEELKKSYGVVWERFEKLPNYKSCTHVPTINLLRLMDSRTYMSLTFIKSSDLFYKAQEGKAEQAIKEWVSYMAFFRNCLSGNQASMVFTSGYSLNFSTMFSVLNDLLLINPTAVSKHQAAIIRELRAFDETILVTPYLPVNEYLSTIPFIAVGIEENNENPHRYFNKNLPHLLQPIYPSNGFLRKLRQCEKKREQLLRGPASGLNEYAFSLICEDEFPSDLNHLIFKSIMTTGNPYGNFTHHLTMGGMLKGSELAVNVRRTQARMKVAEFAINLVSLGVPDSKIESELSLEQPSLGDPITNTPLKYDATQRALFIKTPKKEDKDGWEYFFYLP